MTFPRVTALAVNKAVFALSLLMWAAIVTTEEVDGNWVRFYTRFANHFVFMSTFMPALFVVSPATRLCTASPKG